MTRNLIRLHTMGGHWYATYCTGNLTLSSPTAFPATMSQDDVVVEIRRRAPDIVIALRPEATP